MKSPWKEIIVALLVGGMVGWFAAAKFQDHRPWKKGNMLEHFSRELHLTAEQQQKVAKIMEAKRAQFESLRQEMEPKMDEIKKASRQEIRTILTPEQQKLFDDQCARRDQFKKKHHFHRF